MLFYGKILCLQVIKMLFLRVVKCFRVVMLYGRIRYPQTRGGHCSIFIMLTQAQYNHFVLSLFCQRKKHIHLNKPYSIYILAPNIDQVIRHKTISIQIQRRKHSQALKVTIFRKKQRDETDV